MSDVDFIVLSLSKLFSKSANQFDVYAHSRQPERLQSPTAGIVAV
jgi:hypothetical protein